jgi:asparagine synthase (glutamine-hydrolysing)
VSKFCGVCHFDSRPISREEAARVQSALSCPGYIFPVEYRCPGLIVGWAAGSNDRRGTGLSQSPCGSICLWDGRLDNRKDLLRQTGLPSDCSDSAIVLELFRQKGEDGLRDVVGDWSLCIWDPHNREIVLASDYAGIRPLYFHRSVDSVYWSTSLADLVRCTNITEFDDLYVGAFLLRGSASAQTPYAGISAVPAGRAVSIAENRIASRTFWNLPVHRQIRYQDERQYEDQLLELFREAVQVRIASGTPVCAELSGGLDSSSVVCMVNRLQCEAPGHLPDLTTFSYTHERCPDEKYFREVERACGLSGLHLELQEYSAAVADQAGAVPALWEPRFRKLARRMADLGSAVLLTGQFGDFIMGNTPDDSGPVTEWLAQGRFMEAAREAYAWARSMQVPIYPILWRSIREAWFSWVPPVNPRAAVGAIRTSMEDSLAQEFRERLRSYEQEQPCDEPWRQAPPGRRQRFRGAGEILRSRILQTPDALQHVSYTHPYAHRPLVEFMLTIPGSVVCRPDQQRRLMRRAFAGLLPPMVLNRKSKAAYTSVYRESLMPLAAAMLQRPGGIQLVERGYLDRQSLTSRLERYTQGLDCNESQLRMLILFEFWLRNRVAETAGGVSGLVDVTENM